MDTNNTPQIAKRVIGRPFLPGNEGKKKGTQNHLTRTVKSTVLAVFNELQDDPKANLKAFAIKYPRDFYAIAAKLIPAEITGEFTITRVTEIKLVKKNGSNNEGNPVNEHSNQDN